MTPHLESLLLVGCMSFVLAFVVAFSVGWGTTRAERRHSTRHPAGRRCAHRQLAVCGHTVCGSTADHLKAELIWHVSECRRVRRLVKGTR